MKIELPYDPAIALLDIYPEDYKCGDLKGHVHLNVIATMSTITTLLKEPRCPETDGWMKKCGVCMCIYI